MEHGIYMRSDRHYSSGGTARLDRLLGTWINTNPATDHICKLVVRSGEDGRFYVRLFGAGATAPVDWGEIGGRPVVTGETWEGVGFHASYDFDDVQVLIVSNYAKGVLVIQSYSRFCDGSGRPDYFTREFFHQ